MCGIAGYVDFASETNPSVLSRMTKVITYRGPDSSGVYKSRDNIAALGVRRLRIIDLKTGDQPIKNEDGSVVVIYNGEIYNYKTLKLELEKRGHKFKTKTDTEVLVHGYEEYGENFTLKLNGMFAFALWDEKKRILLLGRDRVGIKPLYYYASSNILIFGSEAKVILAHPLYNKKINEKALSIYCYLGFLPGEISMFSGVKKLLPGHTLTFKKSGLKVSKYFALKPDKEYESKDLDKLLESTVKNQLVADVPVGVFLSGGLDSSLLAYYVTKFKKLKSFSIGFKESGFDESDYAHRVAKKIGTEHISEEFGTKDVINIYESIIPKLDEPLADASLFPTYKVSKLARQYVTVALSGDGGDELFGGYPTHQAHLYAKLLKYLPNPLVSKLLEDLPESVINLIPTSFKDYPKKQLAKIVLRGMKYDDIQRQIYWMRTFFMGDNDLFKKPDFSFLTPVVPNLEDFHKNRVGQVVDFHTYLRDDFLVKTDRASMLNSLEVRVPYLDNDVLSWAFSTDKPHINIFKTKIQLKKILSDKLPEIAKRPKKGFGIPLKHWLKSDLKDFAGERIRDTKLQNYVKRQNIENIWNNHQDGRENNAGSIWMLVMLSGWLNNWV